MSLDFLFGHCPHESTDDDDTNKKHCPSRLPSSNRPRGRRGWRSRSRLFGAKPLASQRPFGPTRYNKKRCHAK
ncbi:hypothetical protein [Pandoravirus japonicus]|uniref:Uncharacterized protein n=1 Tax=Pandoravirus japonicus TaxID=2823154 RepID=A0A811BRJ5_9VIRU|nr:hypothetical protein [Pandoravirus japonicus]